MLQSIFQIRDDDFLELRVTWTPGDGSKQQRRKCQGDIIAVRFRLASHELAIRFVFGECLFPFPSSAKSRAVVGLEALAPFFGFLHQKKLQAGQLVSMHRAKE